MLLVCVRTERRGVLTEHQIKHITFLISPMQSKTLYSARKEGVLFCTVKDVEPTTEIVGVFTAKVDVERMEDDASSNGVMKGGKEEPSSEEIARNIVSYAFPYLERYSLGSWLMVKPNLAML